MKFNPYLIFNGCAEEALNFYMSVFGGQVERLIRYADTPMAAPDDYRQKVCHARFVFEHDVIMLSDALPGHASPLFNPSIGLTVSFAGEPARAKALFDALAVGGQVRMPVAAQFWGAEFGMLQDRFGVTWMFNSLES